LKRLDFLRNFTIFALFSLLISSCTKELSPIGIGLLSDVDLLSMGYTDTVQITAYSVPEDSVYTAKLNYTQIGSMYDPIFGITTANFYSQIFLTKSRTRFGTTPVFDSAYLYLPIKSSYGDTLSNMNLKVYALSESIYDSLHSYSSSTISHDEIPIGEIIYQPRPHDSSFFNGAKQIPLLRIPINSLFGYRILNADTNWLNNNANFVKFFQGICIIAEPRTTPGTGSIVTFSVPSDYSSIQMFYHNPGDTVKSYVFAITSDCSRFQNYDHNGYAEAIPMLRNQLDRTDLALGEQFLYAQGMGGVKIKIQFPYLSKWFDTQKIVINDAQLVLGNASVSDVFPNPSQVTLRGIGEAGGTSPLPIVDENEGSAYFDGFFNQSTNSYRFRLTRYIQQVLTGQVNNNGLYLIIPSSSYVGTRLVLNGVSSPQSDLKLFLRFTKINQ
jgi:hypothetical protein